LALLGEIKGFKGKRGKLKRESQIKSCTKGGPVAEKKGRLVSRRVPEMAFGRDSLSTVPPVEKKTRGGFRRKSRPTKYRAERPG